MTLKTCSCRLLVAALAWLMAPSAFAIDSVSLEVGAGDQTHLLRVGLQSQWPTTWPQSNGTQLGAYWDLTFSRWHWAPAPGASQANQELYDLGITPVFRLQSDSKQGFYAEMGIGAHLLFSDYYDASGQPFSTRFQFGDHFGVGYVMQNGMDLSLKIQHFSNGGIRQPNPGVLFGIVKLGYAF